MTFVTAVSTSSSPAVRALLDPDPAVLVLEDGRIMRGHAYGAVGETFGEAVFSTGMSGYQETLTDPSYHRQVVVMTSPHVGNTGMNDEDPESTRIWVSGYVVRDPARVPSSWRSRRYKQLYYVKLGTLRALCLHWARPLISVFPSASTVSPSHELGIYTRQLATTLDSDISHDPLRVISRR